MVKESDRCLRALEFNDRVLAVDWSPDGTRLATGDYGGGVEVLMADGRRLWRRIRHTEFVADVRWSPDGKRLASGSNDCSVRIWDVHDGTEDVVICPRMGVIAINWSPDSRRIACNGYGVSIFDASSGQKIEDWLVPDANCVSWSPSGSHLAASHGWEVQLRDDRTHQELTSLVGHTGMVLRLAWAHDGQRFASASWDKTVRIWSVAKEKCILTLKGHRDNVNSAYWSPDGKLIASGSKDRTVRIWSTETGKELIRMDGHVDTVWTVPFSPEGIHVASASDDGSVRIWNISDISDMTENPSSGKNQWTKKAAINATVRRRRKALAHCSQVLNMQHQVLAAEWSPDGTMLAIGDRAGGVEVRTVEGRRLWRIREGVGLVCALSWSFDSAYIVVAYHLKPLTVYEVANRERVLCTLEGIRTAAFSPRSHLFAEAGGRFLRVRDLTTDELLFRSEVHYSTVWSVAWSADGLRLATGGSDDAVRVWDAETGRCLQTMKGPAESALGVQCVTWGPGDKWIASGSHDKAVRIWSCATGHELIQCEGHTDRVRSVAWSPRGNFVASASGDGTIRLWAPTGREIVRLEEHASKVCSLSFSPNGAKLVSTSLDKTVRIWDVSHLISTRIGRAQSPAFEAYVTHQAATVGRRVKTLVPSTPLPPDLKRLPDAFCHLARLALHVPLSDLRVLLHFTGYAPACNENIEPLLSHPGIRKLAGLRWPVASRPGLVALLLKDVPRSDEWQPPEDATPTQLRDALANALNGVAIEPAAPPLPVAALTQAADAIDQRLLTLLELVGPDAVAAEPGLPLRLLPQASKLPVLAAPRRRLLGLRLRLDRGGPAHGHGAGAERTGIDVRGDWRSIVPWQLALPDVVLHGRHLRNEILYRARSGEEPPRLRPTVLVLDVSPPTFGPVEGATRLAAHVIASSLLEAGLPLVLVTAGGRGSVRTLERPSDLVDLWTSRSPEGADDAGALRLASAMRETLAGDELAPVVVLLSHAFFGADEDALPDVPGLRGFFVQYPGRTVRPTLAEACERWQSVAAGEVEGLEERLGRLVG